jgi:hypothetical protein
MITYAPEEKDHPFFENWVYVASAEAVLLIHPQFKMSMVDALRMIPQTSLVYASEYPRALVMSAPLLLMSVLVSTLTDIGCQSVRIQAFGMKAPLLAFMDPARHSTHPLDQLNI